MDKPVIIFGASGLGKLALEIFQSNGNLVYGLLDENKEIFGTEINDVPVLGSLDDQGFLKLIGQKCEAFVAVDDKKLQKGLVSMLNERRKVMPVNAIHSEAYLSTSTVLGHGNLFSPGVVLNANAKLGNHNILHANSVIDYGAILGDYLQIGTGSVVGAEANLGDEVFIGSGVVIVPGVKIGAKARIGAGSVVVSDIPDKQTVFGNPAKPVEAD